MNKILNDKRMMRLLVLLFMFKFYLYFFLFSYFFLKYALIPHSSFIPLGFSHLFHIFPYHFLGVKPNTNLILVMLASLFHLCCLIDMLISLKILHITMKGCWLKHCLVFSVHVLETFETNTILVNHYYSLSLED